MAVVYSTPVKNDRLEVVVAALGSAGLLVIGTDAMAGGPAGVLVEVQLSTPAAAVAGGVLSLADMPRSGDAIATGIAARAELRTMGGVVVVSGLTVGVSASDVVVNAVEVSAGQLVQVTAGTIVHG